MSNQVRNISLVIVLLVVFSVVFLLATVIFPSLKNIISSVDPQVQQCRQEKSVSSYPDGTKSRWDWKPLFAYVSAGLADDGAAVATLLVPNSAPNSRLMTFTIHSRLGYFFNDFVNFLTNRNILTLGPLEGDVKFLAVLNCEGVIFVSE